MNTPDPRPIGVLTAEILATASHWCIHRKGIADIRPSSTLTLRVSDFDDDLPLLTCEGECYWDDDSGWMCYPCTLQPNGLIMPEPWPVLDGEEEIEEWRGYNDNAQRFFDMAWGWCLVTDMYAPNPFQSAVRAGQRPGMVPGLRRGNRWVWEKDR